MHPIFAASICDDSKIRSLMSPKFFKDFQSCESIVRIYYRFRVTARHYISGEGSHNYKIFIDSKVRCFPEFFMFASLRLHCNGYYHRVKVLFFYTNLQCQLIGSAKNV